MKHARTFAVAIFCLSLLLSAGSLQAQRRRSKKPTLKRPIVRPVDAEGLKKLLARNTETPRPLLINFWATWCAPCRDEFPDLVRIYADYRERGLETIVVSLDDVADIGTLVPRFLARMKSNIPAYLFDGSDPEPAINSVDPEWSGALPATFLFNPQGELVFKHTGRFQTDELRAAIDLMLK